MKDAIYFPIHRAKEGEITGLGHLSPVTRARVRPTFEVQKPGADDVRLEEHLANVAQQLLQAWGNRYPFFADFSLYEPGIKVDDGRHCSQFFFNCLRQQSMLAIPMTGPESVRGPGYEYIDAVAKIAAKDGRGAGIRIPYAEFSDIEKLKHAISDTLEALRLSPAAIDLFLDFESLTLLPQGLQNPQAIVSILAEALEYCAKMGCRNLIVCGSSVPERVNKEYDWNALRVERAEYFAWQSLVDDFGISVKFGDYGPIFALEQDVKKPVRPPARIRLTTPTEHVMWRAPRADYTKLCERVVASKDFDPELAAWGTTVLYQCARYGRGKGGPAEWVARDTNLHVEVTVRAVESTLRRGGRLSTLSFADAEMYPWNQAVIDA